MVSKVHVCVIAFLILFLGSVITVSHAAANPLTPPDIEASVKEALQLYHEGRLSEAVQKLEDATRILPKDSPTSLVASLYALLAFFQEKSGNTEKAETTFEMVQDFFQKLKGMPPESEALAKTLIQFARHLRAQDQLQFWQRLRRPVSTSHGKAGEAFVMMQIAEVYLGLNDFMKAYEHGREALQHAREAGEDSIQVIASITISGSLIGLGRVQEAESLLQEFLPKSHGKPVLKAYVLAQLGLASAALNHEKPAIQTFQEAITLVRSVGATDHEARLRLKFGLAYLMLGKPQTGIQEFLTCLKLYETLNDEMSVALIEGMIAQAYFGTGAFEEANQHASRAAELFRRLGNRAEEAKNLRIAGQSLAALNKPDEALTVLEKAVYLQVEAKDRNGALETFGWIIGLLKREGRIEDAKRALLTGLDTYAAVFGDKEGEAAIRSELAKVYRELGFFSDALAQYRRIFSLYQQLSDKRSQILTLLEEASILAILNDYENRLYILSLAGELGAGLDDPNLQSNILNATASAYEDLGDTVEALQRYLESLEISRQISKWHELLQLPIVGLFYERMGEYAKALDYFKKALTLAREIGDRIEEGRTLVPIGGTYLMMRRLEDAVRASREALEILRATKAEKSDERLALELLGLALTAQGRYEAALQVHQERLQLALESGSPYYIQQAYSALGYLSLKMGKYSEAVEAYKKAIEITENLRTKIIDEKHQTGLFEKQLLPYDGIVDALYNLYLASGPEKDRWAEDALYFAELSKARSLGEQLSRARVEFVKETVPADVLKQEKDIIDRALIAYGDYSRTSVRYRISEEEIKNKEQVYRSALGVWTAFVIELRRKYPQYATLKYPEALRLQAFAVQDGETVVVYKLGISWAYAWVIRKVDDRNRIVKFTRLPIPTRDIEKKVEKFLLPLRKIKYERFDSDVATELFNLILKPALDGLNIPARMVIVPDRVLNVFPFEALVVEVKDGEGNPKLRFIGDQSIVSYYPSATILTINRRTIPATLAAEGTLLAVGDPVYGPDDERLLQAKVKPLRETSKESEKIITRNVKVRAGARERGYSFDRLKYSGLEVLKISQIFGSKPGHRDILIGMKASENQIKSRDLTKYRYLHFAVHGVLAYDVPYIKEPALVLVPDSKEDGFLTMSEIYRLKLKADLVVLSACETGLGLRIAGEGVVGLNRAFMYAGTRSILISLWQIADESTALLMEEFYRLLNQGVNKAEALTKAKQYLRGKNYENPFFWAPFVLVGD